VIRSRTLTVGLALSLVLGSLGACGGDDSDGASTTSTTTVAPEGALPPAAALDLEPTYGPALAELGLRLVDRGGLIDRSGGGYDPSPTGTHLGLYVEPIGDERSVDEYLDGIRSVGVVFSDLFERWPGLVSYDVCQEPIEDDGDPATEPLPVTQIELTKEESAAIDWDTATVVDLLRAAIAEPPEMAVRVSSSMATEPAYKAIEAEASD